MQSALAYKSDQQPGRQNSMAIVYVEPRPKGGDHPTHYVVEDRADHQLNGNFQTQADAIAWAKRQGHSPRVAHVRHTDKGNPDHWRPV